MSKSLFIAEKTSVAKEFAKVLKINAKQKNGYLEGENTIITWCVGHLITMSYPESYDPALKKWSLAALPFLPEDFIYEVIPGVKKQYDIVSGLLNRSDVGTIYVCTDSGREGEYIYRLVDQEAKVPEAKRKLRVWIDSQTEDEIIRGIKEAKPISEYDALSDSAFLRAKEDYLMGINFSRVLTLKYGSWLTNHSKDKKWSAVAVGRVMTCVLGMVVTREREIRDFVKTPFFRILADFCREEKGFRAEWKAAEGSKYFGTPALYKENGLKEKAAALALIDMLMKPEEERKATVDSVQKKREKKNPPLLFNLAEIQNLASKLFKISPEETLKIIQELYEKKLVTYPRTDARVLSAAVAKEIHKNLRGLTGFGLTSDFTKEILEKEYYKGLEKTRYVNDKQITDHYAIIPTGQGLGALKSLTPTALKMYEVIVRRFLSVFYPAAEYQKINVTVKMKNEYFFASEKILIVEGYLPVSEYSFGKKEQRETDQSKSAADHKADIKNKEDMERESEAEKEAEVQATIDFLSLKKGMELSVENMMTKEGETSPPKRYHSGSMILAMENAGHLIEDEELREQMKGSGIGTSATRSGILEKLFKISYMKLNPKTQVITPTLKGKLVYGIVYCSIPSMLDPTLTASWEKGLEGVAEGNISKEQYMEKLQEFVSKWVSVSRNKNETIRLSNYLKTIEPYYQSGKEGV